MLCVSVACLFLCWSENVHNLNLFQKLRMTCLDCFRKKHAFLYFVLSQRELTRKWQKTCSITFASICSRWQHTKGQPTFLVAGGGGNRATQCVCSCVSREGLALADWSSEYAFPFSVAQNFKSRTAKTSTRICRNEPTEREEYRLSIFVYNPWCTEWEKMSSQNYHGSESAKPPSSRLSLYSASA